ncbi:MAG TPA: agmatine deiminase family protein [Elusimicrobiales bacterium]|nr:agmatine deiminase family protein [Elusimicrobiales bacterium]
MRNLNIAALLVLALLCPSVYAEESSAPLPNWLDPSERIQKSLSETSPKTPPPPDFRLTAEYEPAGAVVVGWAGYTDMLSAIARAVTGPGGAKLWAAAGPESIAGVPAESYSRINIKVNSVWSRDYGPFGISASQGKAAIVDTVYRHYQYRTSDDAAPGNIGRIKGLDVYGTDLVLDGGNVLVDSAGNLFMTVRTYAWNSGMSRDQVDSALKRYFNVKNIYTFDYAGYPGEPADGTGHIDMFMKLLNDHTVLISLADTEPFKSNSEKALAFFRDRQAPDGEPYKIITVKGWAKSGTWYTYTNSLIVNNVAVIPSYSGSAQDNAAAKEAYEAGMRGVTVVQVPSDSSIKAGGSIHCVTQVIPKASNLSLTVAPEFTGTSGTGEPVYEDVALTSPGDAALEPGERALGQLVLQAAPGQ